MNTIKTIIPKTNGFIAKMAAKIEKPEDLDEIPDFLLAKNQPKTPAPVVAHPIPAPSPVKAPPVAVSKKPMVTKASPKKPATEPRKPEKPAKAPKAKGAAKTILTLPSPSESKTDMVGRLLRRKEGCTTAEILAETKWPAVSVPQLAKANHLKLRKEKVKGQPTRYFGV